MKEFKWDLKNFQELAYEFAIRNPNVIELLHSELNKKTYKELLKFGIDIESDYLPSSSDDEDGMGIIYSLRELYLDYNHLKGLSYTPFSPYGEGQFWDDNGIFHNEYKGNKRLIHPLSKVFWSNKETDEKAIFRIKSLIETRGKKLERLMSGDAFKNFDAVKFCRKTVYEIDDTSKTTKTIKSDVEFIDKWLQPNNYLQLLPQYTSWLD